MRIDIHTHIGVEEKRVFHRLHPYCLSAEELLRQMDESQIDYAVVFPFPHSMYFDPRDYLALKPTGLMNYPYEIENKHTIYESEQFGQGRLLPFVCIDPIREVDKQIVQIKEWINEKRIYGFKLHTKELNVHGDVLIDSPFAKLARVHKLSIIIHSLPQEISHPLPILKFAKSEPEINICIAHGGGFIKEFYEQLDKLHLKNVFFDFAPLGVLSSIIENEGKRFNTKLLDLTYNNPKELLRYMVQKYRQNMLFGSDLPYTSLINPVEKAHFISSLKEEVELYNILNKEDRKQIFEINPLRYLNLTKRMLSI